MDAPSTTTTSERPTFAQAFAASAAADSQTATPSTPTPSADPSAATTPQPATQTSAEAVPTPDAPTGEPPKERWPDILKHAREKAAAEKQAEFDREFGWARSVPRETLQEWTGIANRMATDPIAFLQELQTEIANHPVFGPQLRSHAARTLAAGRTEKPVDLSPDLVVDDGQGKQIATFSAERVQQIVQHAIQDALGREVGPLKQDLQTRQAQQHATETQRQVEARVDRTFDRVSKLELYEKYEAEIATAFEAMPADLDPGEALLLAYHQVVGPKLKAHAQAEHLESLKTKAAASTVNPAAPTVSTTKRPTSFYDSSLTWR